MPAPAQAAADLPTRCQPIELLVLDVDGVLTDGVIALDDRGAEIKRFHVRDGSALGLWRRAGKQAALLSGRRSPAVAHRAAELGLAPVIQGATDKLGAFHALLHASGLQPRQVGYVGDDWPDLPVLRVAGLAACPADATAEVRQFAHLVTHAPGGRGAVREVIETLLKHQGMWETLVSNTQILS